MDHGGLALAGTNGAKNKNNMKHARVVVNAVVAIVAACMAPLVAVAQHQQLVPCMYIFGDSLVDNGNNNNILSLARANYRPYGIDFTEGPAGRFTNGRTVVDFVSELLGLRPPLIPAYAMARQSDLARGLNFASGAAGIRPETGNNLGWHYPLSEQVNHFRAAIRDMGMGNASKLLLGRCIYYVGMGSNDYLNNYFMPSYYTTGQDYDPPTYAALLLQDYSRQLNDLYHLGARKFVIAGVGQIGCIPYELARINNNQGRRPSNSNSNSSSSASGGGGGGAGRSPDTTSSSTSPGRKPSFAGGCNDRINSAIAIYNKGLLSMVKRFNRGQQLPGAKFVFLNTVQTSKDLVTNAATYGFTMIDRGCCGVGRNNGQITCLPLQRPCDDRSKYIFWDAFHPTEAANRILAAKFFNSTSTADAYPINISQLAAM